MPISRSTGRVACLRNCDGGDINSAVIMAISITIKKNELKMNILNQMIINPILKRHIFDNT